MVAFPTASRNASMPRHDSRNAKVRRTRSHSTIVFHNLRYHRNSWHILSQITMGWSAAEEGRIHVTDNLWSGPALLKVNPRAPRPAILTEASVLTERIFQDPVGSTVKDFSFRLAAPTRQEGGPPRRRNWYSFVFRRQLRRRGGFHFDWPSVLLVLLCVETALSKERVAIFRPMTTRWALVFPPTERPGAHLGGQSL